MTKEEILEQIGDLIEELLNVVPKSQENDVREFRSEFRNLEDRLA